MPGGFGAPTAYMDPRRNQLPIGTSLDEQLCSLPLPGLARGSFREPDRQARLLREQIGAPCGQLDEAGQGLGFLGFSERSAPRIPRRRSGDPRSQNPVSISLAHPSMIEHMFETEDALLARENFPYVFLKARGARRTPVVS
jgi:hypothetical protein